jgi:hypothetical protein
MTLVRRLLWPLGVLLVALVVVAALLPGARCVLTGRPVKYKSKVRLGGRCYELQTCTEDCSRHIETLAKRLPGDVVDVPSNDHPTQVAVEVPC